MSPSSSQIEREVEASRANLEETVEALKDKMSVGQIVDEAARYLGNSGGADILAKLGEQARANPLPLALVGIGLAWLMSGRGQPHLRSRRRDDYGYGYDPDYELQGDDPDYRRMHGAAVYEGASHPDYASRSTGTGDAWPAGEPASEGGGIGGVASGIGSTVSGVASSVAHAASAAAGALGSAASAASRVGRTAYSAAGSVAGGARSGAGAALRGGSRAYRGASRFGSGAYEGASHLGSGAYESASQLGSQAYGSASRIGRSARRGFSGALESEPLVLGAVGLAVGAAIGALLPRTETEDRYFGDTRDRLREDAEAYAREKYEQGIKVAEEAYRTALAEAEAKGLTTTGEDSVVGRVSEVARAALEKARRSAAEAGLVGSSDEQSSGQGGYQPSQNAEQSVGATSAASGEAAGNWNRTT